MSLRMSELMGKSKELRKKGGRSGIMTIGLDNIEELLILDVTLHSEKQEKYLWFFTI